jgi:D-sedoheptulose 7-phosphate isomerase
MFSTQQYVSEFVRVLHDVDSAAVERTAELVAVAWSARRTVFLSGNGGSAASASHIAADLTKLTAPALGRRLRAVSLTDSLPAISAIANDLAYDEVFAEQLRSFAQPHDVVIGLSTSGSSPNVLRAIEVANAMGAHSVGITGRNGRKLRDLAHHTITVDSTSVQYVEDATMIAGHMICLRVKEAVQALSLRQHVEPVLPLPTPLRASL